MGPNNRTAPKNAKNCASVLIGRTSEPNFSVTFGAIPRSVASYVRTLSVEALTSKADRAALRSPRRKTSCSGETAGAGGRTSRTHGAGDTARPNIGHDPLSTSSSTTMGQGRPGPARCRFAGGGEADAAAFQGTAEKAAR